MLLYGCAANDLDMARRDADETHMTSTARCEGSHSIRVEASNTPPVQADQCCTGIGNMRSAHESNQSPKSNTNYIIALTKANTLVKQRWHPSFRIIQANPILLAASTSPPRPLPIFSPKALRAAYPRPRTNPRGGQQKELRPAGTCHRIHMA